MEASMHPSTLRESIPPSPDGDNNDADTHTTVPDGIFHAARTTHHERRRE
jgi:hypothetical protein